MALEKVFDEYVSKAQCSNQPLFDGAVNYDELSKAYVAAAALYKNEKKEGESFEDYMQARNLRNPKDPELYPSKNYSLLISELQQRQAGNALTELEVDTGNLERSLLELTEAAENSQQIRELYRIRKQTTKFDGGISLEEAVRLKHCMSQGRELFLSGFQSSLQVKPLSYFYALTAYSYAVIILNNPIRFRKDMLPGSHGLNYLPNDIHVQFGGDTARGTFSDLHASFPENSIRSSNLEVIGDNTKSIVEFNNMKFTASLGTLLSMVPEIKKYFQIVTGRASRAHKMDAYSETRYSKHSYVFLIGDGQKRPTEAELQRAFPDAQIGEDNGRSKIIVGDEHVSRLSLTSYTDLHGDLWFVENPFYPVVLPEINLHFLILAIFSNLMRYRPDEWGELVDNNVEMGTSLLVRHYFSAIERKFNMLILRNVSQFFPYAPRAV